MANGERCKLCSLHQMAQRHRRTPVELQEQFPIVTEHPAWEASKRNLEYVGFSGEEIARLFSVKARYQRGAYHEVTPAYKRLAFARWLYQQGLLQS